RTPNATGTARRVAKVTPRVLGMISVKISTATVNVPEKIQSVDGSNTSPYWAPATDAPTVWATVLRIRMAAIGASTSRLNPRRISAARDLPSASICAWLTVSSTASEMEQRNEKISAEATARTNAAI